MTVAMKSSVACWLLVALAASIPAQAGSVFMKNGYIIQGPILEHSEEYVVLGWQNGKVTIYRRFLEKVDFEPGEEKRVRPRETAAPQVEEDLVVTSDAGEEIFTQNLSDVIEGIGLPRALIDGRPTAASDPVAKGAAGGSGAEPAGTDPAPAAAPSGDPEGAMPGVEVAAAPPSDSPPEGQGPSETPSASTVARGSPEGQLALAERVRDPRWGFSLQPPAGWNAAETNGVVSWTGSAGPAGFAPSLNVTSIRRGSLGWDEACRALREDQAGPLQDYALVTEGALRLGGFPAFEVAGQGKAGDGRAKERRLAVRQVLVEEADRLWLVSAFLDVDSPEDQASLLASAVESFLPEP